MNRGTSAVVEVPGAKDVSVSFKTVPADQVGADGVARYVKNDDGSYTVLISEDALGMDVARAIDACD